MDNFLSNLKNKLMLPASEDSNEEDVNPRVPIIPMLDVDRLSIMNESPGPPSRGPQKNLDVTDILNEPRQESQKPVKISSKTNLNVKTISAEKPNEGELIQPQQLPNPIEDDVFINYD